MTEKQEAEEYRVQVREHLREHFHDFVRTPCTLISKTRIPAENRKRKHGKRSLKRCEERGNCKPCCHEYQTVIAIFRKRPIHCQEHFMLLWNVRKQYVVFDDY